MAYFDSSHIWTMLEAVAKTGSVRWWSIELNSQKKTGCFISVKSLLATGNFLILECIFRWEHVQRRGFLLKKNNN